MQSKNKRSRYFPTREQELLLRASLLEGEDVLVAWQKWQQQIDIEKLDGSSHKLLTLLYRNLVFHEVKDSQLLIIKGVYRWTWSANQLILKKVQSILKEFQDAEIEILVLSDVALLNNYYQDSGHRPIHTINLLARSVDASKALRLLEKLDWKLQKNNAFPGATLQDSSNHSLFLSTHLFFASPQSHTDDLVWSDSISGKIGNVSTKFLSNADELLYVCSQGFKTNQIRQIHWLADAMRIICKSEVEIDWIRLVTQAQRYELILPLKNMLNLLQGILEVSIPDWVIPSLSKMPVSHSELLTYQVFPDNRQLQVKAWLLQGLYRIKRAAAGRLETAPTRDLGRNFP